MTKLYDVSNTLYLYLKRLSGTFTLLNSLQNVYGSTQNAQ